ncbi:sensor histidine kinase [Piscicoccus intestinalis]|uniref:sensor histidine kinase n=1 Tax=Piscicoccus intestinalis TaxID=746033 RepID=UPI0008381DC2|nr:ATP-binding protein [Piscicoccus intestinalis]
MTQGSSAQARVVGGATQAPRPHRRRLLQGWSLRRKLVASMLALFVVVSLLTGLGTLLTMQRSLESELDQQVVSQSGRFRPDIEPDGFHGRGPGPGLGGDFLLLQLEGGVPVESVAFTRDGTATALTSAQVSTLTSAGLSNHPRTVDLDGQLGRYRLVATTRGGSTIITGLPTARLDESLDRLRELTLGLGVGGLMLLGAGSTWLVRRNLRPLERVAATATRVSTMPLSSGQVQLAERVPAADTDRRTEVGQVGAALNDLLDHVDSALNARHASEQRLRQFVADASHELRTPLASIRGYAELSHREREPVPQTVRHALNRIESEAGRMSSLVEDLLLLARLDAGRPLERAPVDLTRLLLDAVSDAQVAGRDHHWRLDLPDEAVEVVGDQARLTQVVVNLLANARVHTPAGTTVTGRVRRTDVCGDGVVGDVVIEVEDDGPGIDPDLLPRIFGRFTRGDTARVRAGGSTGLGLSIVQAVAQAHHGGVDVESRPGRTVFRVILPGDAAAA